MPALPAVPASLGEAIELAAANSPALKQAEQGVVIARAAERGARAQGMPTIGAFAEAAHVRDQFFPGYKANSAAVGLRGRWTPFAGGRTSADTRTAAAELAGANARARQARQNLEGLVIDSWHGLTAAEAVLVASQARVTAAEAALRGIRLEARVGAKPTLAVLDAEREATEAQKALIDAEGRRQVTAWRLNALTGAGQ
jgi:outer membrane protein